MYENLFFPLRIVYSEYNKGEAIAEASIMSLEAVNDVFACLCSQFWQLPYSVRCDATASKTAQQPVVLWKITNIAEQ